MEINDKRFEDLINRGFHIRFYKEERNYPMTGKYTAYCIALEKNGQTKVDHFSLKSHEVAFNLVCDLLTAVEECENKKVS